MSSPLRSPSPVNQNVPGGVGDSPLRPDGRQKVRGEFAYSSDLWMDGMVWGATLRSPHPYATIVSLDIGPALRLDGVRAVLTADDIPGDNIHGLDTHDQPVLAVDVVRYQGEPVALVAADHPETARRALELIEVEYELREPLTDSFQAVADPDGTKGPKLHEHGNIVRSQPVLVGDTEAATADVVVSESFEVGMQDQAFLGPESALAVPAEDGGVDLYVSTQWLHWDLWQIAPVLDLPEDKIRLTLSGVGGAFGGREDISCQIHSALLALHTGKPVKMMYNREESFYGHVHRHPARMKYEYGADRNGKLVYGKVEIVLDGGAYASATPNVVGNAASLAVGPYEFPNLDIVAHGTYSNNPPCGAMRGFGAVQACYAYESMMDLVAARLDMSPVEFRRRNAVSEGSQLATGQVIDSPAPLADMLRRLEDMPLPPPLPESGHHGYDLPGGLGNTTKGEGVRRGIGYGVGIKNICFSEGFDDYSTARVRLEPVAGAPQATVHTAGIEVGQGLVTLLAQIARTELGVENVTILPSDTQIGSGGSTSASRQSYMTGGAVKTACEAVREVVADRVGRASDAIVLQGGKILNLEGEVIADLYDALDDPVEEVREYHHRPTQKMDPVTGQGDSHTQLGICVHRAIVDVDVELGLIKVVELQAVQDVGTILNRLSLEGQIHGGTAQGLGLAVMEEIQVNEGLVRNPSFTDYLIPTIADMPPMRIEILEHPDPYAPYGLRGAGEPPTLSSTPAIAAAIRDASGKTLTRVPVRPEDLTGT
ncbi:xanthine dehydrogenase subunit D [Haloglycomyces albus]|uniref:xanthine dehydrogenase subunit D n=1 Tax=Haloglycomyces albus TaxID=526067 RepID=UPI00046CE173|nr:xanthine dehydrogenase subunit D [Haloglycomyces albus]